MEIVKQNGEREEFDRDKLRASLLRAKTTEILANEIVGKVEAEIKDGDTTSEIYRKAFGMLEKTERKSAIKYSIRRSILNLGPSGFPFEDYIAELFKAKGYKTLHGQVLQGKCTKHEVDVIAYKDLRHELVLFEVKFHNDLKFKNDTKDALYIKARFDDLSDINLDIKGENMKMTRGVFITNTKFTKNSQEYMKCAGGVDMISWDYPENGNLYDIIEETQLHPMTCVPILTKDDKEELLRRGIINCPDLKDNVSVMKEIGMSQGKIDEILKDLDLVCSHAGSFEKEKAQA